MMFVTLLVALYVKRQQVKRFDLGFGLGDKNIRRARQRLITQGSKLKYICLLCGSGIPDITCRMCGSHMKKPVF